MKLYVQVSGVHGVGKTSLVESLSSKRGWTALKEEVCEEPLFPLGSTGHRGFANELWILSNMLYSRRRAIEGVVLCDRGFEDALAYSSVLLDGELFHAFKAIWRRLYEIYPFKPDLVLLLHDDPERIKRNVERRARPTMAEWRENDIDYITRVQEAFLKIFSRGDAYLIACDDFGRAAREAENIILRRLSSLSAGADVT